MLSGVMRYYRSGRTALITASRAQNKGYSSGQKRKLLNAKKSCGEGSILSQRKTKRRNCPNQHQRLAGIDRRARAKSSILSTPESLRSNPRIVPCPPPPLLILPPLAPVIGDSWCSSATLLRTTPALVGCGVVRRGAAPRLLMRPNRVSPPSGTIQSIEMPPTVLLLPWPLEPPLA